MEPSPTADPQERAERLLRDAHILRMRQQWAQAEDLCRQALELTPEDLTGLEMLGDLLMEKGSLDEALDLYRRAFERQPQRAPLEHKIARAVLQKNEEERERLAAQTLLTSRGSYAERKRSSTIALLLSLICAGAGQIFKGQYLKGSLLLGAWLLSILGWADLFKFVLGVSGLLPRGETVNDGLALLGMVGGAVYLYSLIDAPTPPRRPGKSPAG